MSIVDFVEFVINYFPFDFNFSVGSTFDGMCKQTLVLKPDRTRNKVISFPQQKYSLSLIDLYPDIFGNTTLYNKSHIQRKNYVLFKNPSST